MKLQLLVNHCQETSEILSRFLQSVNEQIVLSGNDIEILICTDGYENELTDTNFQASQFPVRYFVRPHYGVCRTRNTLLDLADADYLMFCDCDDIFSKSNGLQILIECAVRSQADVIGSDYDIELKRSDEFVYRKAHQNISRVHGKIFRRQYLLQEGIRFPDEMPFSGDMYFLYLAYHLTENIVWLLDDFYVWKWRADSITRKMEHYSVYNYGRMLQCYLLTMHELQRRGRNDLYQELVVRQVTGAYLDYFSSKFKKAPNTLIESARNAIQSMLAQVKNDYFAVPEKERQKIYIQMLVNRRSYGPPGKFEGLSTWLEENVHNL